MQNIYICKEVQKNKQVKMMHKFWHLSALAAWAAERNARVARQILWPYLFCPCLGYLQLQWHLDGEEMKGGGRGGLFRWLTQIRRTHLEIVYERAATTTWIALSTRKQHDKTNRRAKAYIPIDIYIYEYISPYL